MREILDAVFYIVRSGCAWRLLPHGFPPWKTIHHYFRTWRIDGIWENQSVKTTGVGGDRGYDGGKKVKGLKRHLLIDTERLVLKAKVHVANIVDQEGSSRCLSVLRSCSHASRICGWMLVTGVKTQGQRLGGEGLGVNRVPRRTSAQTCPGGSLEVVGPAVEQRGRGGRLAEAHAAPRFPSPTSPLGRGAGVLLDRSQPPDEQGL